VAASLGEFVEHLVQSGLMTTHEVRAFVGNLPPD